MLGYSLLVYRSKFLIGGMYVIKVMFKVLTDQRTRKICCLHNVNKKTSNTCTVLFWFRLAKYKVCPIILYFIFAFFTDHIFLHCLNYLLMCRLLLICTNVKVCITDISNLSVTSRCLSLKCGGTPMFREYRCSTHQRTICSTLGRNTK